jgi:2-methylisocitrate lyase-like PEP mutase family enzyme
MQAANSGHRINKQIAEIAEFCASLQAARAARK